MSDSKIDSQGEGSPLHPHIIRGAEAAAAYTGFSRSWIFQQTSRRQIPHFRKGRKLFFLASELDEWLLGRRVLTMEQLNAEVERRIK